MDLEPNLSRRSKEGTVIITEKNSDDDGITLQTDGTKSNSSSLL